MFVQSLVSWLNVQNPQICTLSKGHSFKECFFLHLGQYIDNSNSCSSCLFFVFKVSIWFPKVLIRSVLKSSNKLPNSALVIFLVVDFVIFYVIALFPILVLLLENFWHNSAISSKGKLETSPLSMRLRSSKYSSWMLLRKIVRIRSIT